MFGESKMSGPERPEKKSEGWKIEDYEKIKRELLKYPQPDKSGELKIGEKYTEEYGDYEKEYVDNGGRIIVEQFGQTSDTMEEDLTNSSQSAHIEYEYSKEGNITGVRFLKNNGGEKDQAEYEFTKVGKMDVIYEDGKAKKIKVEQLIEDNDETIGREIRYKRNIEVNIIYSGEKIDRIEQITEIEKEDGSRINFSDQVKCSSSSDLREIIRDIVGDVGSSDIDRDSNIVSKEPKISEKKNDELERRELPVEIIKILDKEIAGKYEIRGITIAAVSGLKGVPVDLNKRPFDKTAKIKVRFKDGIEKTYFFRHQYKEYYKDREWVLDKE